MKNFLQRIKSFSDIRDVFVFGGLGMLGYGLYLKWGEGVALIVCGGIGFILGLLWPVFLNYTARDK